MSSKEIMADGSIEDIAHDVLKPYVEEPMQNISYIKCVLARANMLPKFATTVRSISSEELKSACLFA
tara:strand:- start:827 stop:1027 length:201 start_codon:yes stop_codon:yes gene_type:complete